MTWKTVLLYFIRFSEYEGCGRVALMKFLSLSFVLVAGIFLAQPPNPTSTPRLQTLTVGFYGAEDSPAAQGIALALSQMEAEGGVTGGDGGLYVMEGQFSEDSDELADAAMVILDGEPPAGANWEMPVVTLDSDLALPEGVFRGLTAHAHLDAALLDFLTVQSGVRRVFLLGLESEAWQSQELIEIKAQDSALLTAEDFQGLLDFNPQAILYGGDTISAARLIDELGRQGWRGFFVVPNPREVLVEVELAPGIRLIESLPWDSSAGDDLSVAFKTSYFETFESSPDARSLAGYDLAWMLRLLIGRVGGDPELLRAALPTTNVIRVTAGQINPGVYGGGELIRSAFIVERQSQAEAVVLARYDGGFLLGSAVDAFPTPTLLPSPTPSGAVFTVQNQELNVRSGPSEDYPVLGQFSAGDQVVVLGVLDDERWLLVQSPWGPAWVQARFGELFMPAEGVVPVLTPPPTPTPSPTPRPSVQNVPQISAPPQVAAAPSGSIELGGQVRSQDAVPRMQQIGMSWVKEQVRWERGETPENGAAGAISAARSRGIKILISSVGHVFEMGGDLDSYLEEYTTYLGQVAAVGPDAIEVWNEPNIDREWPNGQIDGATYTRLLQKAYEKIKAANPNVMVISGALAPTGFFGGTCSAAGCDDDVFLRQMAAAGAGNYMDCVGAHYNEGVVSASQSSGDPRGGHHSYYFTAILSLYSDAFGGARPVCFTEIGYLTGDGFGGLPAGFEWAGETSVQDQASFLADAVRTARADSRVKMLIIWNVDFTDFSNDPRAGYAILRPDGTCPACDSLTEALR
jgi:hypothetical protein